MNKNIEDCDNAIRGQNERFKSFLDYLFGKFQTQSQENEKNKILLNEKTKDYNEIQHSTQEQSKEYDEYQHALKDTQYRLIQLNNNERKRRMHYIYIILIWVGAFLIIFCMIMLCKLLPVWIPCKIFIFLIVLTACCVSIYLYWDLTKRDPTDYDKLKLPPPDLVTSGTGMPASNTDFAMFALGFCTSASCCASGTTWDSVNSVCIAGAPPPS